MRRSSGMKSAKQVSYASWMNPQSIIYTQGGRESKTKKIGSKREDHDGLTFVASFGALRRVREGVEFFGSGRLGWYVEVNNFVLKNLLKEFTFSTFFIAIGIEYFPFYTPGQMASVTGMDKVAKSLDAKFMLAVGDNYYHSGVTDENDPRFGSTFEKVYSPQSLQFPWYAIAGNHGTFV